jgi:MerR family transcriptional regulator, light-induced transcriptional regulator
MAAKQDRDAEEAGRRARVVAAVRRAYEGCVLAGDPALAERTIREAIDAGLDQATIDDEIIAPAMRRVGHMWERGELDVGEEHLATEISIRVLALQREAFRVARRRAGRRVMLAAIQGERHVLGLNMAADVLLQGGYDVRLLGPDVPAEAIVAAVRRHRPAVVGLSVTMPELAGLVPAIVADLQRADPGIGVVVGGGAATERVREGSGLAVCTHVADAVEVVDTLVQRPAMN